MPPDSGLFLNPSDKASTMEDLSLIKQQPFAVGTLNHCYPPSQE
ncbi:MAG: hypothetical protein ABW157_12610 [Candidatus Thiodiazotropha sp. LLP2]